MPVHVRALKYVVERTGAKLFPAAYKAFRKYDVRATNQLFGKSGGKGFRHGRDLGLIIGGEYLLPGDDLDAPGNEPGTPYQTRKFTQARGRNQRRRQYGRCKCYGRNQYRR